jgi:hypothetical protein
MKTTKNTKKGKSWEDEQLKQAVIRIKSIPPTRFFSKDDRVSYGSHEEIYVEEILFDGFAYKLKSIHHIKPNTQLDSQPAEGTVSYLTSLWVKVFPYTLPTFRGNEEVFSIKEDINIQYYNSTIESMLHKHYSQGIDYTPEYQREYVWNLEDKVALIDSIMHNIDIGKFTFIELPYKESIKREGRSFEVLDGKQRMNALIGFYEDRFTYRGKKFSELSFIDRHKFEDHHVSFAHLQNLNREQILRTFVKLNTAGKVMDQLHIEKVKKIWEEELKKNKPYEKTDFEDFLDRNNINLEDE